METTSEHCDTPKMNTYCPIRLGAQYAGMDVVVIPLSSGAHTIVDAADFPKVAGYPWYESSNGRHTSYAYCGIGGRYHRKHFALHRFLLNPPRDMVVDHINRNGLDNRRCNLRVLTLSQNLMNSPSITGGYKGAHYCKRTGRWSANIMKDGKNYWLGRHDTAEEAARAYDRAALELHGPHAYLNFPEEHKEKAS